LYEIYFRAYVNHTRDTTSEEYEKRYYGFLDNLMPQLMVFQNDLSQKLVDSDIVPAGMEVPIKWMKADLEIFREENLPLLTQLEKLGSEYDKTNGEQTVEWMGEELTIPQVQPLLKDTDREKRETV